MALDIPIFWSVQDDGVSPETSIVPESLRVLGVQNLPWGSSAHWRSPGSGGGRLDPTTTAEAEADAAISAASPGADDADTYGLVYADIEIPTHDIAAGNNPLYGTYYDELGRLLGVAGKDYVFHFNTSDTRVDAADLTAWETNRFATNSSGIVQPFYIANNNRTATEVYNLNNQGPNAVALSIAAGIPLFCAISVEYTGTDDLVDNEAFLIQLDAAKLALSQSGVTVGGIILWGGNAQDNAAYETFFFNNISAFYTGSYALQNTAKPPLLDRCGAAKSLFNGDGNTIHIILGDSFCAQIPTCERMPYGIPRVAPWTKLSSFDFAIRSASGDTDGNYATELSEFIAHGGSTRPNQFDDNDYEVLPSAERYPLPRECVQSIQVAASNDLGQTGTQNEWARLKLLLQSSGGVFDPDECNAQLQETSTSPLGYRSLFYHAPDADMFPETFYLADTGSTAESGAISLTADSIRCAHNTIRNRDSFGGTFGTNGAPDDSTLGAYYCTDTGSFEHCTDQRDLLLENFDAEGDPVVSWRLAAFTPTVGDWWNTYGGVVYALDSNSWDTDRGPGIHILSISSLDYVHVAASESAASKAFLGSRLAEYLWMTLPSLSVNIVVHYYFAAESKGADAGVTATTQITNMVEGVTTALDAIGITPKHNFIVPHMHMVTGESDEAGSRAALEANRDAAIAIAESRSDMDVTSIYDATNGILFNGSAEAKAYLGDTYVAGNGVSYDFSATGLNGDLLDAGELHPAGTGSREFFADKLFVAAGFTGGGQRSRSRSRER